MTEQPDQPEQETSDDTEAAADAAAFDAAVETEENSE